MSAERQMHRALHPMIFWNFLKVVTNDELYKLIVTCSRLAPQFIAKNLGVVNHWALIDPPRNKLENVNATIDVALYDVWLMFAYNVEKVF